MRILQYLLLTEFIFCLFGCTQEKTTSFEVMTWNIWHGGLHGSAADSFEKDTANTINVLKVLQEEDPDIVFMQETYCCGMDIAKEAGYMHSWRGSSNLSIHSKFPIVDTIHLFRPFNSHAAVIDIEGQEVLCVNLWLHYLPDYFKRIRNEPVDSILLDESKTRLAEIVAIMDVVDSLEQALNLPVIIGGDFNSASHLDWIAATRDAHYGMVVEWPVSQVMMDSGYTDSFREANPDPLNSLDGTWGYLSDDIISDRIDYIYYKGVTLRNDTSSIIQDDPKGGFFNSDHRAILTSFELKE